MAPRQPTQADQVRHWIEMIQKEKHALEETLANISEYSERLRQACEDTHQKLIGRS